MRKQITLFALLCIFVSMQSFAQERTLTGKVTSSQDKQSIPGITVMVKGTTIATSTDIDGNFKISVPASSKTIMFTGIGMKNKEVELGTSDVMDVVMDPDLIKLNEVVVTALGIEREKRALGYSTQEVSGNAITGAKETNVVNALSGKIAGVQVQSSAGVPGASTKIYLRGANSFIGDNQPLFVVDGIPYDNTTKSARTNDYPFNELLQDVNYSNRALDIDPNDIESVNVLKGPQAAVLYGEKGANGAIIITTKRAKYGQKTMVTVSSNIGFDQVNQLPEFQDVYAQGSGGNYITWLPGPDGLYGTDDDPSTGTPNSWGPKISDVPGLSAHDNVKNYFQTGTTFTNSASISAGNENNAYRFSISRVSQTGIVPNTYFKRINAKLTSQSQLSKKIDVNTSASYSEDGGNHAQQGSNLSGVCLGLYRTPASYDLENGSSEIWEHPNGAQYNYFASYDNPYWTAYNNTFKDNTKRFDGNFAANYYPVNWLRVTWRNGLDAYTDARKGVFAIGSNNSAQTYPGQITEQVFTYQLLSSDLFATINHKLGPINLNATIGGGMSQESTDNVVARGRNLAIPKFYNLGNASDFYGENTKTRSRTSAFFADLNFSWHDMIFIGVTGRDEASSKVGINNRSTFYPGVNGALVFTEFGFLKDNKILSFGKLRAAWAQSANSGLSYSSYDTYYKPFFTDGFTNGFAFPYLGNNGFGKGQTIANPDLEHELTSGPELGAELKFIQDRITVDFTWYKQTTKNVIVQLPVPYSSGYWNYLVNAGKIENKGIELTGGIVPVRTKNFEWNVGVNWTINENRVVELPGDLTQFNLEVGFGDPDPYAILDKPYGTLYGTYWERAANGQLLIDDDGYPIVATDTKDLGNPFPRYQLGISTALKYKGFTLSGLLDIKNGGQAWCGTQARLNRIGISKGSEDREHDYVVEGVHADGTPNSTAIPAIDYWQYVEGDFGATENQIQKTDWVRLRDLSLSYTYAKFKKYIRSIEISVSGRNLFLNTPYTGNDPETSLTGAGSNYQGIDWFGMPNTKSYNFGVKVTL